MLERFGNKKVIFRVLVVIVIGLATALGYRAILKAWHVEGTTLHAKKTLAIHIEQDQREKFFKQLIIFADVNNLDIEIYPITPAGDTFNIDMSDKAIIIIANNVFDTNIFEISIYNKNPTNPLPEEIIEGMFNKLIDTLSEISSVTIVEKD